jgi:peptidyl-prolyl cis-trans isomerase C
MSETIDTFAAVARVNGVAVHGPAETVAPETLRQRACTELLRQAAQREGLLAAADAPGTDGAIGEAATAAIDALLERVLRVPEPSDEACRRHHAAHAGRYATGERVRLRHILFAVTPGVDVVALRRRAEDTLLEVRCHDGTAGDGFADAARALSNCPSGAEGGDLGWVEAADCAPEFAREIFGRAEVGVLPRLVHSRFGLHVVEVRAREPGVVPEFAAVRGAAAVALRQQGFVTALRQYLQVLADAAIIEGVDLERTATPLGR